MSPAKAVHQKVTPLCRNRASPLLSPNADGAPAPHHLQVRPVSPLTIAALWGHLVTCCPHLHLSEHPCWPEESVRHDLASGPGEQGGFWPRLRITFPKKPVIELAQGLVPHLKAQWPLSPLGGSHSTLLWPHKCSNAVAPTDNTVVRVMDTDCAPDLPRRLPVH